jgi:16S rRNA processing protein RimM
MELYTIGKIVGAQGIKGELKVYPQTSFPERFLQMEKVIVGNDLTKREYKILNVRDHKNVIILNLDGIDDRNQAEALVGQELFVTREELYELPEDCFYIFDLIGLKVEDKKWGLLGKIKDVIEGAQDLYLVTPEESAPAKVEFYIPAVKAFVLAINLETGVMQVDLPEGLWEE